MSQALTEATLLNDFESLAKRITVLERTVSNLTVSAIGIGAFRAFRNTAQSLSTGAVVNFDAEEFDISSWFDIVTTVGRYTPQIAGYYRLSWMVSSGTAMTVDNFFQVNLFKNAGIAAQGQPMNYRTAALGTFSSGTDIVHANGTTDFFEVQVLFNNVGTIAVSTGTSASYFTGHPIGRA